MATASCRVGDGRGLTFRVWRMSTPEAPRSHRCAVRSQVTLSWSSGRVIALCIARASRRATQLSSYLFETAARINADSTTVRYRQASQRSLSRRATGGGSRDGKRHRGQTNRTKGAGGRRSNDNSCVWCALLCCAAHMNTAPLSLVLRGMGIPPHGACRTVSSMLPAQEVARTDHE